MLPTILYQKHRQATSHSWTALTVLQNSLIFPAHNSLISHIQNTTANKALFSCVSKNEQPYCDDNFINSTDFQTSFTAWESVKFATKLGFILITWYYDIHHRFIDLAISHCPEIGWYRAQTHVSSVRSHPYRPNAHNRPWVWFLLTETSVNGKITNLLTKTKRKKSARTETQQKGKIRNGTYQRREITSRPAAAGNPCCSVYKLWQKYISAKSVHLTSLYPTALMSTNDDFTALRHYVCT